MRGGFMGWFCDQGVGGEVSKERFESDGAAAHEPGVDLENPVKVSVARKCKERGEEGMPSQENLAWMVSTW